MLAQYLVLQEATSSRKKIKEFKESVNSFQTDKDRIFLVHCSGKLMHRWPKIYVTTVSQASPVHKLLGNFSTTLRFFDNFQLVKQLSMHRATSQFLCLCSHIRIFLTNPLVLLLGSTCFYEKVSLKTRGYNKATI